MGTGLLDPGAGEQTGRGEVELSFVANWDALDGGRRGGQREERLVEAL